MKNFTFTLLFLTFSAGLFATQSKKTLTLRMSSPDGNSTVTTLYFDDGITPAYNVNEDAKYVPNNIPGIPEFYSFTSDKVMCSINGCGTLLSAETVDLGYYVNYPGTYTIQATAENFDPTSIIRLVDNELGDTIDLGVNFFSGALDSTDNGDNRFQILISSPVQYSSTPSNCSNTGGTITVNPDTTIRWDEVELIDSAANSVLQTVTYLDAPITFSNLAEGSYQVVYVYNGHTATNDFYVSGNFVVASIGTPSLPIYTNTDAVFNAFTTNANQYYWDFGDSTLITGVANPTQTYITPGTYTVTLYASNEYGCSASAQATVIVMQGYATGINEPVKNGPAIITQGKVVTVNMNDAVLSDNAQVQVYNLLGQSVKLLSLTAQTATINLENESNGIYLVSIRNAGEVNTARVFIAR